MESREASFFRAKKRVKQISGFYTHLAVFLVVNIIMYAVKDSTMSLIIEKSGIHEIGFENYLHWQFWTITISWAVILIIQGLKLYGRPLIAKWEQRKIQEYINGDDL
ncbi:2TM domain-containing protein [Flagellimonas flava]|uniref:2TM domain-containing protein n=1 Tax=Flagellimonas flava TaxID=570519 RepID=A0A1M5I2I7_9FLAO|nr:2TM domain-containing protein [Allomuricauda flava]SHG22392.1 2TM domain-containing protein [Allomuricauda flava]